MERGSTSLVIKEMKTKTKTHHFTQIWMAITRKTESNKYWQECKEIRVLYSNIGRNANGAAAMENGVAIFQKPIKSRITI